MRAQQKFYRSILRSVAGLSALLVFSSSLLTAPVQQKTYESTALLANVVGMYVGVAANPDNTVAAQLAQKEAELTQRETALRAQVPIPEERGYDLLSLVALAVSALVLLLVVLNFYFDHLHTIESKRGPLQKV